MFAKTVSTLKQFNNNRYQIYLFVVSTIGILLVTWSMTQVVGFENKLNFFLLLTLAMVAQITSTNMSISQNTEIILAVGNAVTIAIIPFYGPAGAVIVSAFSTLSIWLATSYRKEGWEKSWRQLPVNTGMQSIAVFCAGYAFIFIEQLVEPVIILKVILPWLAAAIVDDQVNLFILMGILRLQRGKEISIRDIWQANLWSMPISIAITSIGGGMLAYAVTQFGWIGIIIFFLPIVLSAYAFRLYVNQMQAHMDNLENIIDERTKELQNVMKEKDAFLAVLTHDMKTPLTSIGIYGELIQKHPELIVKKPHMATIITQSQKTLLDIVNNILDLEKLNVDGQLPMDIEEFDLVPSVEKVVENLRPQAMQKEICLQADLSKLPILFNGDRNQLERVMQNLISNGIKYTPQEGQVDVSLKRDSDHVIIEVADTGYGIPEEELPYVFDRFRRVAKHKKKAAGTGLGLAITQQLVQAHNGNINVSSIEGEGTTFTIQLPLQPNYNTTE